MPLLLKEKLRFVKTSQIAEFAFVMYFANAMLRTFFRWIFGGNNLIAIVMTLIMLYIPVLSFKKNNNFIYKIKKN